MLEKEGKPDAALSELVTQRVKSRSYDPLQVARIRDLSLSPSGKADFDAAAICELFDHPVPSPDFTSWEYRYIKGPLRPLARWIYNKLRQIIDRTQENRTQAFHNIAFELAELRRQHEELKKQVEAAGLPRPKPQTESSGRIPRPL